MSEPDMQPDEAPSLGVDGPYGPQEIRDLPVADIIEIANIRPEYLGIESLASSMAEQGQLEPILVRPAPPGAQHGMPWELVFGHRRVRAARMLEWPTVRSQIRDLGPEQILEVMLTENLQREQMSPIAEAKTMRAMIDLGGMSQAEVGRRMGVDPSQVSHRLRLLALSQPVIEKIDRGEITASHGEALAALPPAKQEKYAERVVRDGVSVRRLENWVREQKAEELEEPPPPPEALDPVRPTDVVPLPQMYLREGLSDGDWARLTVFALLRNGNDNEMLIWLEDELQVEWEGIWSWVRELSDEQASAFVCTLLGRYVSAAHRFMSFENSFRNDLGGGPPPPSVEQVMATMARPPEGLPPVVAPPAPRPPELIDAKWDDADEADMDAGMAAVDPAESAEWETGDHPAPEEGPSALAEEGPSVETNVAPDASPQWSEDMDEWDDAIPADLDDDDLD